MDNHDTANQSSRLSSGIADLPLTPFGMKSPASYKRNYASKNKLSRRNLKSPCQPVENSPVWNDKENCFGFPLNVENINTRRLDNRRKKCFRNSETTLLNKEKNTMRLINRRDSVFTDIDDGSFVEFTEHSNNFLPPLSQDHPNQYYYTCVDVNETLYSTSSKIPEAPVGFHKFVDGVKNRFILNKIEEEVLLENNKEPKKSLFNFDESIITGSRDITQLKKRKAKRKPKIIMHSTQNAVGDQLGFQGQNLDLSSLTSRLSIRDEDKRDVPLVEETKECIVISDTDDEDSIRYQFSSNKKKLDHNCTRTNTNLMKYIGEGASLISEDVSMLSTTKPNNEYEIHEESAEDIPVTNVYPKVVSHNGNKNIKSPDSATNMHQLYVDDYNSDVDVRVVKWVLNSPFKNSSFGASLLDQKDEGEGREIMQRQTYIENNSLDLRLSENGDKLGDTIFTLGRFPESPVEPPCTKVHKSINFTNDASASELDMHEFTNMKNNVLKGSAQEFNITDDESTTVDVEGSDNKKSEIYKKLNFTNDCSIYSEVIDESTNLKKSGMEDSIFNEENDKNKEYRKSESQNIIQSLNFTNESSTSNEEIVEYSDTEECNSRNKRPSNERPLGNGSNKTKSKETALFENTDRSCRESINLRLSFSSEESTSIPRVNPVLADVNTYNHKSNNVHETISQKDGKLPKKVSIVQRLTRDKNFVESSLNNFKGDSYNLGNKYSHNSPDMNYMNRNNENKSELPSFSLHLRLSETPNGNVSISGFRSNNQSERNSVIESNDSENNEDNELSSNIMRLDNHRKNNKYSPGDILSPEVLKSNRNSKNTSMSSDDGFLPDVITLNREKKYVNQSCDNGHVSDLKTNFRWTRKLSKTDSFPTDDGILPEHVNKLLKNQNFITSKKLYSDDGLSPDVDKESNHSKNCFGDVLSSDDDELVPDLASKSFSSNSQLSRYEEKGFKNKDSEVDSNIQKIRDELDKLYSTDWRKNEDEIIKKAKDSKKSISPLYEVCNLGNDTKSKSNKIIFNRRLSSEERSSDDNLSNYLNNWKQTNKIKQNKKQLVPLDEFIVSDSDDIQTLSRTPTPVRNNKNYKIKTLTARTEPPHKPNYKWRKPGRIIESSSSDSEGEVLAVLKTKKKLLPKTPKQNPRFVLTKSFSEIKKVNTSVCPPKILSFLSSLSPDTPLSKAHPDAQPFIKSFHKEKVRLTTKLYNYFNSHVFDNRLPAQMGIKWNPRMTKTAGYCYYQMDKSKANGRGSRIELSNKVIDSPGRLRDTLIHELCHAASWIISGYKDGHGPLWKSWASKAMKEFPELPLINRCHSYHINCKYNYRCIKCGYSIGRHSKSLDTEKKVCGYCHGKFELLVYYVSKPPQNSTSGPGGGLSMPGLSTPRTPNAFALYVKENYVSVKRTKSHLKHQGIMKALSQDFAKLKTKN